MLILNFVFMTGQHGPLRTKITGMHNNYPPQLPGHDSSHLRSVVSTLVYYRHAHFPPINIPVMPHQGNFIRSASAQIISGGNFGLQHGGLGICSVIPHGGRHQHSSISRLVAFVRVYAERSFFLAFFSDFSRLDICICSAITTQRHIAQAPY
jgi:hypothetical protein